MLDVKKLQALRDKILGVTVDPSTYGDLNSVVYLQQILDAVKGTDPLNIRGNLAEHIYLQKILNAKRGIADGQFGSLPNSIYLQQLINAYSGVADGQFGSLSENSYLDALITVAAGGAWSPTFLFLDKFTSNDNAPLTNPLTAEPGPGSWNVTNTNNALAKLAGKLIVVGQTTASLDGIISAAGLSRVDGLTALWSYSSYVSGDPIIGLALGATLGLSCLGVFIANTGITSRHGPIILCGGALSSYSSYAVMTFSTGSALFGYSSGSWKFLFMERLTTTTPLYPQINNHTENPVNYAINGYGVAVIPDMSLAAMQTDSKASANAGDTITHAANGVIECTRTLLAGETFEFSFRRTDDDNRWILRVVVNTDTATLVERNAGVETVRATDATKNFVANSSHWFFVRVTGNSIFCGFDNPTTSDGSLFSYASATFNNTATGAKVSAAATQFNSYSETPLASVSTPLNAMLAQVNP